MSVNIKSFLSPILRCSNISVSFMSTKSPVKEEKIQVGKFNINYVKVGNGAHHVLCMPGTMGTIWTDFKPQVEGFDREKYTVVAWDPPGLGKSRPPERHFETNYYEKDAETAYQFMQSLNISKYSILGWSDGGINGLIHAAKFPNAMRKLVIWGSASFRLPQELKKIRDLKDIKSLSKKLREPMIEIYGEKLFTKYLSQTIDIVIKIAEKNNGNISSEILKDIKCPSFILYGQKDPIIDEFHVSYLHTHIKNSSVILYGNLQEISEFFVASERVKYLLRNAFDQQSHHRCFLLSQNGALCL